MPLFDRNPLFRIPYLELLLRVMSNGVVSTIDASGDILTTLGDTLTTLRDILTTLGDTFTTLHDTLAHDAKVDLRRIVSDFLTVGNRVGCASHVSPLMLPAS